MRYIPSESITDQKKGEKIVSLEELEADTIFEALSSSTARSILYEIYAEPGTISELAKRTDNSVQTVTYHLDSFLDAGLVQLKGTKYSEKGSEMDIYGPINDKIIIYIGGAGEKLDKKDIIKPNIGIISILFVVSLYISFSKINAVVANQGLFDLLLQSSGMDFFMGGLFVCILFSAWVGWRMVDQ